MAVSAAVIFKALKFINSPEGKGFMKFASGAKSNPLSTSGQALGAVLKGVGGKNTNVENNDITNFADMLLQGDSDNPVSSTEQLKRIREAAIGSPVEYIVNAVEKAAVHGTRAVGDIAQNNTKLLAKALLGTADRLGPSQFSTGLVGAGMNAAAANMVRKGANTGILTDAIANTIEDTYDKWDSDNERLREYELGMTAPLSRSVNDNMISQRTTSDRVAGRKAKERSRKATQRLNDRAKRGN